MESLDPMHAASGPLGRFLRSVATQRRWWWVLLALNSVGSLYGFWWYRSQLLATPYRYWLVVPDSPGSTFLLTFFLLGLLLGAVPGADEQGGRPVSLHGWTALLSAVAFASNMKYGLWTAIVLPQHAIAANHWTFDAVHLSLSHAGMWLQGMLFLHYYRPGIAPALGAWAWLFFQDFVDYWALHTYPTLPDPGQEPFARAVAVTLSVIWGGVVVLKAWRHRVGR